MSEIHHFIFFILFYFIFLYNKTKQIFLCIPDLLIGYLLSSIAELINNIPHQNIKRLSSNWNRLRREKERDMKERKYKARVSFLIAQKYGKISSSEPRRN